RQLPPHLSLPLGLDAPSTPRQSWRRMQAGPAGSPTIGLLEDEWRNCRRSSIAGSLDRDANRTKLLLPQRARRATAAATPGRRATPPSRAATAPVAARRAGKVPAPAAGPAPVDGSVVTPPASPPPIPPDPVASSPESEPAEPSAPDSSSSLEFGSPDPSPVSPPSGS